MPRGQGNFDVISGIVRRAFETINAPSCKNNSGDGGNGIAWPACTVCHPSRIHSREHARKRIASKPPPSPPNEKKEEETVGLNS